MKNVVFLFILGSSVSVFANTSEKIDFNSQIKQESQLQTETHRHLSEKIQNDNLSSINEKLSADSNKIILTTDGPQLITSGKKDLNKKNKKKAALVKNTLLEEEEFQRLEQEIDSLNK